MTEVCDYCGKPLDSRMEKWVMYDKLGQIVCHRQYCSSCADHLRHYGDWRKYNAGKKNGI